MSESNDSRLIKRTRNRLKDYNYNSPGAYFITICTENKKSILSRVVVVGDDVLGVPKKTDDVLGVPKKTEGDALNTPVNIELLPYGKITEKFIRQLNDFYEGINVDYYVIMPNHIHIMLSIPENGTPRTSSPTISVFVSTLKRFCNKECGKNIWQRSFYDHIIRNKEDYEKHVKYIYENPLKWHCDELYSVE